MLQPALVLVLAVYAAANCDAPIDGTVTSVLRLVLTNTAPANSSLIECSGTNAGATCMYSCNAGFSPSVGTNVVTSCNGTDWISNAACTGVLLNEACGD